MNEYFRIPIPKIPRWAWGPIIAGGLFILSLFAIPGTLILNVTYIHQQIDQIADSMPFSGPTFRWVANGVLELVLVHPVIAGGCNNGFDLDPTPGGTPGDTICCECRDDHAGDWFALYCDNMPGDRPKGDWWKERAEADNICPARDTGGGGGGGSSPTPTPIPTAGPPPGNGGDGGGNSRKESTPVPIPYAGPLFNRPRLLPGECADVNLLEDREDFVSAYQSVLEEDICTISVLRALYEVESGGVDPPKPGNYWLDVTGSDAGRADWLRGKGYITYLLVIYPHYAPDPRNLCPNCPLYRALEGHLMNELLRGPGLSEVEFVPIMVDVTEDLSGAPNLWHLPSDEFLELRKQLARELTELFQTVYETSGPPLFDPWDGMEVYKAKLLFDQVMDIRGNVNR